MAGALGGLGSRKRLKLDVSARSALGPQQPEASSSRAAEASGHLLEPLAISIWAGTCFPTRKRATCLCRSMPLTHSTYRLPQAARVWERGPRLLKRPGRILTQQ